MKTVVTNLNGNIDTTICLIADIHFYQDYSIKRLNKIVSKIKSLNPKYICITGDIIDVSNMQYSVQINRLYKFIQDLANITKVIISLGNHDVTDTKGNYQYPDLMVYKFKNINNVIVLDNEIYEENNIRFIGYTQNKGYKYQESNNEDAVVNEINSLIKNIDNNKYNILLSHNPLHISNDKVYNNINNYNMLNLILSGHTHNGMIPNFIKTNNLLITPGKKWFHKDGRGHYKKNDTDIVVTGGIIKLSKTAKFLHSFNFLFTMNMDYIIINNNK